MLVFSFIFALTGCNADGSLNLDGGMGVDGGEKSTDADHDGYNDATYGGTDCDDSDAAVNPGALELCDSVDNDCDDLVDGADNNNVGIWFGPDFDYDTYVDSVAIVAACDMSDFDEMVEKLGVDTAELDKWVEVPTVQYGSDGSLAYPDCDDEDAMVNPWATESCDGKDNDCNELVDDGVGTPSTWYADSDSDTYGDASSTTTSCTQPSGYVSDATDCDDGDSAINPAAAEMCDYVDNDCDLSIDGSDSTDATTWYRDADIDGYGTTGPTIEACFSAPAGYAATSTDCDDTDASANPGAAEVCDSVDNDCNGSVDDGAGAPTDWYRDADSDGYGDDSRAAVSACLSPSSYVGNNTDCDDTDAAVNPAATEVSNGIDDNCIGGIDEGVSCITEVYVLNNQGDATVITADATDGAFDGDWWNGTDSSVSGILATETSLGGAYREYGFVGDICFIAGTTMVKLTGTFDLGEELCVVGGMGSITDAYEDGVALNVTEYDYDTDSDGVDDACYYLITE